MFDGGERHRFARRAALTLLAVFGCAAFAAAAGTGDLRLPEAARNQDPNAVRALLTQKADVQKPDVQKPDVNARSSDGSTALLWLAHWNDVDSADLLLKAGADANIANDFGMTPLSQACINASFEFVRLLLKSGANPNTAIATGETPLMTCAKTGNVDAVRLLVEYGAAVNAKEPAQGQTALMWAAAERHPNVVSALVAAHADLKARSKDGFTPIHFAARVGDLESVKLLLAAGVDVNIQTQTGQSQTGDNDEPVVQIGVTRPLRSGGATGYTPLLVATLRAQVDVALYLLDHGADPNIDAAGFTPLHWASTTWEGYASNPVYGFEDPMSGIPDRQAKLRLVKALLAHGAKVNARMTRRQPSFATGYTDAVGATPLLLAASVDDVEMMRILLAAGADPKIPTATNATAIMAATGLNHGIGESLVTEAQAIDAVKLLLDLGLDPRGETTVGENALFGPAYRGWNTLLAQLIDLGVNVNSVSKAGTTPYRAANGQGDRLGGVLVNKEGVDLLLKHGADPTLGVVCESQNRCREVK
ncbi:MAG TPA: ankyrin repeat domain-containing protein [Bryobacteraceae bacterium]|jgi:ankyrin repeat protein|nr:ankyrin repeat domain-containing protein [Bryobacteraceae bacterium]